jgi:hypothetical protein
MPKPRHTFSATYRKQYVIDLYGFKRGHLAFARHVCRMVDPSTGKKLLIPGRLDRALFAARSYFAVTWMIRTSG